MNDRALQRVADDLADEAERIDRQLLDARRRLRDAMLGQPGAQSFDGDARKPTQSHSDPTARAGTAPDPARRDDATLERALLRALKHTRLACDVLDRYLPRSPSSLERRAVELANTPHCESCARIELRKGIPVIEQPHTKKPSTVNGNLTEAKLLCRWCTDFTKLAGRLPYRRELRIRYEEGKRVHVPVTTTTKARL